MASQKNDRPEENRSPEPAKPATEKDQPVGWIERLVQQSSGLPADSPKPSEPREKTSWSYAGMGIQFAGTTLLFTLMGVYLDRRFGWSPWATVVLSMVSVIGGLYLLIKEMIQQDAPKKKSGGET